MSRKQIRFVLMLVAITLVGVGLYRQRQETAGAPQASMDRGVAPEGNGVRVDPHGQPVVDKVDSPLRVEVKLENTAAAGAQLKIDISAQQAFPEVEVTAERYDNPGTAPAADWTGSVWAGSLKPGEARSLQFEVPYGAAPPARMRITARTVGVNAQRFSSSAIVRPGDTK